MLSLILLEAMVAMHIASKTVLQFLTFNHKNFSAPTLAFRSGTAGLGGRELDLFSV
jgi:hypothetical protein